MYLLFAAGGSSWNGAVNAPCAREACRWFDGAICQAGRVATGKIAMASVGRVVRGHAERSDASSHF
ncbi:hypothetical protein [Bosea sp. Root483D1]|uniref:hypothetical protein n=1 Tax=Bosea sp. Root483D1 TaxID=1736544 RepID=UPI0012E3C924|nr:hypothetical protein [Bosea sp. Root483D1]